MHLLLLSMDADEIGWILQFPHHPQAGIAELKSLVYAPPTGVGVSIASALP
jgi:hypothetical protein